MRKMLSASCGPALRLVIWLSAVLSASSAAFAADQPPTVPLAALFIAQIVLLLLVGRLLGEAMQRIGQPAVKGQLIAGVILGPSVFGALWVLVTHLIGIHSVLGAFVTLNDVAVVHATARGKAGAAAAGGGIFVAAGDLSLIHI